MKKIAICLVTMVATGSMLKAAVSSINPNRSNQKMIVSIDSVQLMQRSKEGTNLINEFEKEKNAALQKLKVLETDIVNLRETVQKQSSLLSKEAMAEKVALITRKERDLTRQRDTMAEDLNQTFQARQEALFTRQMTIAREVFAKKGGSVLMDKRTPGVLAISDDLDITDDVLKVVDAKSISTSATKRS